MDEERKRRWVAHCHRLAEMTYAIADWCEDPEMMKIYIALGGRWIQIAAAGPTGSCDERLTAAARSGSANVPDGLPWVGDDLTLQAPFRTPPG